VLLFAGLDSTTVFERMQIHMAWYTHGCVCLAVCPYASKQATTVGILGLYRYSMHAAEHAKNSLSMKVSTVKRKSLRCS